jgi:D-methionine transport system ATP-binding protein
VIELKKVSKAYAGQQGLTQALNDVSLSVAPGQIYGVMGRSGAGKSTLIRTVNLLERPDSGQVFVGGQSLLSLSEAGLLKARREIGMIFQQFNLLQSRTVFDNIALPLELEKLPRRLIKKRVEELLSLVDLSSKAQAYPDQLSGGQKQRVAIARSLANKPKVLLSDEATSSLDPETTDNILELLKRINRELGLTILLITHEMDVIRKICQRACILEAGAIIEEGQVVDIFSHPKTDIAKRFVLSNLHVAIPEPLQKLLQKNPEDQSVPVVRLTFLGKKVGEPLMVSLLTKFNVITNILQANLNWVQDASIGMSICELLGEREAVVASIQFIQNQGIDVEILGYVNRSATFME